MCKDPSAGLFAGERGKAPCLCYRMKHPTPRAGNKKKVSLLLHEIMCRAVLKTYELLIAKHAHTHARAVPDVGSEGLLQEQAQDQGTVWHHFHVG
jgi:hypothetical protein